MWFYFGLTHAHTYPIRCILCVPILSVLLFILEQTWSTSILFYLFKYLFVALSSFRYNMVSSGSFSLVPAPSEKSYKIITRANDFFERHLYSDAILDYTKVLQLPDLSQCHGEYLALVYSNRSASYLKIEENEKARQDAVKAIHMAPHWPKVYRV